MPEAIKSGALNFDKLWVPTAKNKKIRASHAHNRLRVGAAGSSKSSDALWELVRALLQYPGAYGLILRRTFAELNRSNIVDFKSYIPGELYTWNNSDHTATFYNGSKLFFGHCQNFSEKDLASYQSASFPFIFVDECANIPGSVWTWLGTRNRINPQCQRDASGNYPEPYMLGACNPLGIGWSWYYDMFVLKKPRDLSKDAKGPDKNGRYWLPSPDGGLYEFPLYDPHDWDYVHTTTFDNPYMLKKNPGYIQQLMAKPERERKKLLEGVMEPVGGQFFDCFDPTYDVVNLRADPEAIIWQPWQPRWMGWDWGRGHFNACYWFTLAMVRREEKYKLCTVCYREYVDRGKDYVDISDEVIRLTKLGLPGLSTSEGRDLQRIYFSHEKFGLQMEARSPAESLSKYLLDSGFPPVSPTKMNRVSRAQLLYQMLYRRELVILDNCPDLISAIPQLEADETNIEDVKKTDKSSADKNMDVYDAASYGLFGELGNVPTPKEERDKAKLINAPDDFSKRLLQYKLTLARDKEAQRAELRTPDWMSTEPLIRERDW